MISEPLIVNNFCRGCLSLTNKIAYGNAKVLIISRAAIFFVKRIANAGKIFIQRFNIVCGSGGKTDAGICNQSVKKCFHVLEIVRNLLTVIIPNGLNRIVKIFLRRKPSFKAILEIRGHARGIVNRIDWFKRFPHSVRFLDMKIGVKFRVGTTLVQPKNTPITHTAAICSRKQLKSAGHVFGIRTLYAVCTQAVSNIVGRADPETDIQLVSDCCLIRFEFAILDRCPIQGFPKSLVRVRKVVVNSDVISDIGRVPAKERLLVAREILGKRV